MSSGGLCFLRKLFSAQEQVSESLKYSCNFITRWRTRLEKNVNVVGVIELATSTIMICFLLYLCLNSDTRTFAPFVIMATAVFQAAMFCVLGERLNTEVQSQFEVFTL